MMDENLNKSRNEIIREVKYAQMYYTIAFNSSFIFRKKRFLADFIRKAKIEILKERLE